MWSHPPSLVMNRWHLGHARVVPAFRSWSMRSWKRVSAWVFSSSQIAGISGVPRRPARAAPIVRHVRESRMTGSHVPTMGLAPYTKRGRATGTIELRRRTLTTRIIPLKNGIAPFGRTPSELIVLPFRRSRRLGVRSRRRWLRMHTVARPRPRCGGYIGSRWRSIDGWHASWGQGIEFQAFVAAATWGELMMLDLDPTNSPNRTGGDNYPWCNPSRLRLEIFQADPASKILPPSLLSSSWRRRRHSCCRGMVVVVFGFRQCQSQRVILVVFGGSIAIRLVELEWRNLFHGIIRRGSIIRIVIVIIFVATWRQIDNIRLRHDTLFLSFSLFYLRSFV